MHRARFAFLASPGAGNGDGDAPESVCWVLVSPNNRPLGRSADSYDSYRRCVESVHALRADRERLTVHTGVADRSGQWAWRAELRGTTVAVSSRSYLRVRECMYNLDRFLAAVGEADLMEGARWVGRDAPRNAGPTHTGYGLARSPVLGNVAPPRSALTTGIRGDRRA